MCCEDRMLVGILLEAVKNKAVNSDQVKSGQTATVKNPSGGKSIVSAIAGAIASKAVPKKASKPTETPNPVDVIKKAVKSSPRKPVLSPEEASAKDAERKSNKNKKARAKRAATKTELETLRAKVGNQPHNPDHETKDARQARIASIANNMARNTPQTSKYMKHGLTASEAMQLHDKNRIAKADHTEASKDKNLKYYMKMGYSPDEARIKHAQNGSVKRPGAVSQVLSKIKTKVYDKFGLDEAKDDSDPDAESKPEKGTNPLDAVKKPKVKKAVTGIGPTVVDSNPTLNKSI